MHQPAAAWEQVWGNIHMYVRVGPEMGCVEYGARCIAQQLRTLILWLQHVLEQNSGGVHLGSPETTTYAILSFVHHDQRGKKEYIQAEVALKIGIEFFISTVPSCILQYTSAGAVGP